MKKLGTHASQRKMAVGGSFFLGLVGGGGLVSGPRAVTYRRTARGAAAGDRPHGVMLPVQGCGAGWRRRHSPTFQHAAQGAVKEHAPPGGARLRRARGGWLGDPLAQ